MKNEIRLDSFRCLHSAGLLQRHAKPTWAIFSFLGMWIYCWHWSRTFGGCKSEIGGEGGCLCTISLNKAIVVQAGSEEQQGPLAGKEEMLQTLSGGFTSADFSVFCSVSNTERQAVAIWVVRNLGERVQCFSLSYRSEHPPHNVSFSNLKLTHRNCQHLLFHMEEWSCTALVIQTIMSYQVLYPILPDLLDCNPFRKCPDLQVTVESVRVLGVVGLQVPDEMQHLVEVLTDTWSLLSDCQLHPEISSQLVGYLFYFINASLFNSLMERGTSLSVHIF